jgi:hypothetical protein
VMPSAGSGEPSLMQEAPPAAPSEEAAAAEAQEGAAAPPTMRAADEAEGGGAGAATALPAPIAVRAEAAATVKSGDSVTISVFFENSGRDGVIVAPFPPEVVLRSLATNAIVYAFAPGEASLALSPMESAQYDITWEQTNFNGELVPMGLYAVDVSGVTASLEPAKNGGAPIDARAVAVIEIVSG